MLTFYLSDKGSENRWQGLADECRRRLTEQQIVPGNPGTILQDVATLIEFVGPDGLVTKSRNASLPAECLPALNAKVSHPIELALKRALLRDYPNLAGLFILLRVMDLLRMEGNRVVVCPAALEFWRSLSPTEQYFALLEALLFQAQSSVLGAERKNREETAAFETVTVFLSQLSDRWRNFDDYEAVYVLGAKGDIPPWNLFVQQQLGLIEIRPRGASEEERRYSGGRGWLVGGARLTSWGTAVAWALLGFLRDQIREMKKADAKEEELEADEAPEASEPQDEFGILQPVFQPYFPQWERVYARPRGEARTGTHIFKVSLAGWRGNGRIWCRLGVPADTSLDGLADAILHAFKFDHDHLYDFRYRDQRGKNRVYNHPYSDEGPWTTEIAVGQTDLALKDEMLFTFDYGDNWQFRVRLESIDAGPSRLSKPKVIESAGEAPEQYPNSE